MDETLGSGIVTRPFQKQVIKKKEAAPDDGEIPGIKRVPCKISSFQITSAAPDADAHHITRQSHLTYHKLRRIGMVALRTRRGCNITLFNGDESFKYLTCQDTHVQVL
jgi:hypothetical protein